MKNINEFLKQLENVDIEKSQMSFEEQKSLENTVFEKIASEQKQKVEKSKKNPNFILSKGKNSFNSKRVKLSKHYKTKPYIRLIKRSLVSVCACAVLLVCLNVTMPAFAENLPIVGDVFTWVNENLRQGAGNLKSDELNKYADDVFIKGNPSVNSPDTVSNLPLPSKQNPNPEQTPTPLPVLQNAAVGDNIEVAVTQIFCDGIFLRVGAYIHAEDDSLADFEWITFGNESHDIGAINRPGSAWIGGEEVGISNGFGVFTKKDDQTFVGELAYKLETYIGFDIPYGLKAVPLKQDITKEFEATIRFGGLEAYTGDHIKGTAGGISDYERIYIENSDISFKIDVVPDTSKNRNTKEQTSENGIVLKELVALPSVTMVGFIVPDELKYEADHAELYMETLDGEAFAPYEGYFNQTPDDGIQMDMMFDPIPEDVKVVKVGLINKNDLTIIAEFECEIS